MESPPKPVERLDWLQIARAFAAFYVVTYHAAGRVETLKGDFALHQIFRFGNAGVDLFFVISGFIISYVHASDVGQPQALGRYVYRRAARIYPPFWVLCAAVLPLYFVFPSAGDPFARDLVHVLANVALFPVPPHPIISISWTLIAEVIFYIAFCALILSRRWGSALFAVWIACVLVHNLVHRFPGGYYVNQLLAKDYMDFFGGMLVAHGARRTTFAKVGPWLAIAGFAVMFAAPQIILGTADPENDPISLEVCYTFACMAIVAGVVGLSRASVKAPAFLVGLGAATYSVYLFHWVVGWIIEQLKGPLGPLVSLPAPLLLAVMTVLMITAGYCAYLIVERPLLKAAAALWRRRSRPAVQPASSLP